MRMPAARRIAAPIAAMRRRAEVVPVIGDRLNVVVGEGIEVRARLAVVAPALDHVEEMRNHAGLNDALPARVEIDAPRIARPFREKLELPPHWMKAPHPGVQVYTLFFGRAGRADIRLREHAVAAVEPAVRSPRESIQR